MDALKGAAKDKLMEQIGEVQTFLCGWVVFYPEISLLIVRWKERLSNNFLLLSNADVTCALFLAFFQFPSCPPFSINKQYFDNICVSFFFSLSLYQHTRCELFVFHFGLKKCTLRLINMMSTEYFRNF